MTGGSESVAGDKDGGTRITTQIPVGWQRKVENGTVSYISPNGTVLRSVDEVRVYLWTDGTCKCGLECPLVPNKVFNFDPVGMVQAPGHQTGKVEEDMTKLCNHRRKVDAMEALCQSMQPSQLARLAHATGGVACTVDGKEPRGSVLAHGDGAHCTYPQPRRNHPKSNSINFPLTSPRSVLQNGSVCHTLISRPPEQNSPLKKPITQTPIGSNTPAYVKQQWNPHSHPPRSQNILQRTLHNSTSPNNNLLPNSFSTCPSSSSALIGRMHLPHPQGASVNSPPPLSVCSSPSRRDTFSPHQRSRHSSTSSLSDQGAPGSIFIQGVKLSPPTMPCSSPKPPVPPTSPCSRLEGILQHYKDCNTTNISSNTNSTIFSNQSNHHMSQAPMSAHLNPGDKRNGETAIPLNSAQAPGQLGRPLGHILNQQKSQHHVSSSFPASSLLSAAAKAQLANQKTQSQLNTADVLSAIPLTGLDKEQQSKVLISTLNSSLHPNSTSAKSLTAMLHPHSPSLSQSPPAVTEKTSHRKRQRHSPTVLSMIKESQFSQTSSDLSTPPLLISPTLSPSSPPIPYSDNHRLPVAPPNASLPNTSYSNSALRLQDLEEGSKPGFAHTLLLSSPSPSQPLSALLQLLSMQNAQNTAQQSSSSTAMPGNRHTHPPSSPRPITPQTHQCDNQPTLRFLHPQSQSPVPMPEPSAQQPFCLMGDETTMNLKTTSSNTILNLSQPHTGTQPDLSSSVISFVNQMPSISCLPSLPEKGCGSKTTEVSDHNTYQINQLHQSNHNQAVEIKGPVDTVGQPDSDTRLLGGCDLDHSLSNLTADPADSMPLAEAFPFMNQEQLLQLLSSNAGLPSLLPPFLGSLPLGVWTGSQHSVPGGTQPQQPVQPSGGILNSPLNVLPSTMGTQGELPLSLVSLLNLPGVEGGDKPPGLQAFLMASLLLGQNPGAMLPLPLNLEIPTAQQHMFADGLSLEKTPALLDSVLMGPGLLEALQTLAPPTDGQSLLLSTPLGPPPPGFLSLNPALLAAALAQTEPLANHTPSPPSHSQGTLSSHALVSTSVSCAPLVPTTGQEVCDPLTEQDKHTHTPHFLPPLLAHGVLGDLAALGNINSLHSLLGGGSLLIPQGTSLGVPLPHNQTPLNPLTCLQLTMAPALMGEKQVSLHETPPSQEELPSAQVSQDSLLSPVQTSAQQREGSSGTGLFDPYSSFMDTIYTSFLQVSERAEGGSDSTPLSYPELPSILQQASAPPSLSPRRACSVHNQDLSRLGMDMAQSPARGTPKLSEDPSTPPPSKPAGADALSDAPLHPVFMEEAKTDGSANMCVYSNGIGSGMEGRRQNGDDNEEEEEEDGRRLQGYLSPSERASREAGDDLSRRDTEQSRAEDVHTVSRRGRKRKQSLQRAPELPGGIDSIIEEPTAAMALSRPARSARGKRRRVMR